MLSRTLWTGLTLATSLLLVGCPSSGPELPTGCVPLDTYINIVPRSCTEASVCETWAVQTGLGTGACGADETCELLDPCAPEGDDDDSADGPATWTEVQSTIFVFDCQPCHTTNNQGGLRSLHRYASGWEQIVDVESEQLPGMDLVEPFEPENSYLVHKLRDTHREIGGEDDIMPPPSRDPLTEAQILTVEEWIAQGAPRD